MTVITVLRRDLFIWSHFLLSCLLAQSVFFQPQGGALVPGCTVGRVILWEDQNGQQEQKLCRISTVNLSFYWSKASFCIKRLCGLVGRAPPPLSSWWVCRCRTPLPHTWSKDVPQTSSCCLMLRSAPEKATCLVLRGWRKDAWLLSLCITSAYFGFLSVCFSVCLKLTLVNTRHCHGKEFHLFNLEAYHVLTRECTV